MHCVTVRCRVDELEVHTHGAMALATTMAGLLSLTLASSLAPALATPPPSHFVILISDDTCAKLAACRAKL